ncbi:hypothetical protein ES705_28977 [subsurface metagenome]
MLESVWRRVLQTVFGGGSDINISTEFTELKEALRTIAEASVDTGVADDTSTINYPAVEEKIKYTEDSVLGSSGGDGAWHDALDVDTRGMKSFSAVVKNTDGASSLNWRLRARPSNYSAGADEEIPECPGSETLAAGEKGLAELIKSYSRIKIQVQDTVAMSAADYTIDYLINR